ncbi:MAG: hypothetical protein ACO2ZM_02380 [Francisellaceae bacterium]
MLSAFLLALVIALAASWIITRILYRMTKTRAGQKDRLINAAIVALSFFCISSFCYVIFLNFFGS